MRPRACRAARRVARVVSWIGPIGSWAGRGWLVCVVLSCGERISWWTFRRGQGGVWMDGGGGLIFSLAVFFPEVGEVASRGVWEGGRGAM